MNITQISSSFFSPVSDFRDKHLLPIAMVAHSQNENSDNSQFSKLSSEFITREMGAFAQNQHAFYSLLFSLFIFFELGRCHYTCCKYS